MVGCGTGSVGSSVGVGVGVTVGVGVAVGISAVGETVVVGSSPDVRESSAHPARSTAAAATATNPARPILTSLRRPEHGVSSAVATSTWYRSIVNGPPHHQASSRSTRLTSMVKHTRSS
ncbi:hypothetical protein E1269_10600 [Jiangella asiatica]|uniref:Uncharacterized protein n=1 Tax=Jiangella asiatica TaxID=2530372 RepID=A0A4R5DJZ3_9ACTN|nr:hypothetical protein E1269_10600 [Jiangella asiatica]